MITCNECKQELPDTEFVFVSNWNNLTDLRKDKLCRKCRNLEQKLKKYKLTSYQYYRLVHDQGGKCKICEVVVTAKNTAVDHDHSTGVVRGILCYNCNTALGKFRDNPSLLRKAADYIDSFSVRGGESWARLETAPVTEMPKLYL